MEKPKKKKAKAKAEDDFDINLDEPPWETEEEKVADQIGIDLAMECPVCRSLEACECEEPDRSFLRRIRFEEDVKKVARCPRCQTALTAVLLPRPGTEPPHDLAHMVAIWGCVCCSGPALATVILQQARGNR